MKYNKDASSHGEIEFWKWFVVNESRIFAFERDQEAIFDELQREMNRVDHDLTFEFGPIRDGKREFVISAGGIKTAFPAVESLFRQAPSLDRWVWVKFRSRRFPINDLEIEGKEVKANDVHYLLAKDGEKLGVLLFFDGYTEEERNTYGQFGYLFLDEALGEYAVETKVGFIEFQSRESKHFARAHPLREMPEQFDRYWDG
jgi:hypothetical protein